MALEQAGQSLDIKKLKEKSYTNYTSTTGGDRGSGRGYGINNISKLLKKKTT